MTEPALDRFRSSTIGWLRGTLAGWGTALLFVTGIVLTIAGIGQRLVDVPGLPLILTAIATGIIATVWVRNKAAAYEITDERLVEMGSDAAAFVYRGRAFRASGGPPIDARMSSVYVRRDGRWRLALYQQTPVPDEESVEL